MNWLLFGRSKLSTNYLQNDPPPTMAYAIEVWGSAKALNIVRIQNFQSKVLQSILVVPWFMPNHSYRPEYSLHNQLDKIHISNVALQIV